MLRPLSARNPRIQRLAKLAQRREERDRQRALLVEGPQLIGAALDAGADVQEVFVDQDAHDRPGVQTVLTRCQAAGLDCWLVPSGVLQRVGDARTSQGMTATVAHEPQEVPRAGEHSFVLTLAGVADPGNAGTLVRAAVAAGADAVVFAEGVDPTHPKVIRSSAGAWFSVPIIAGITITATLAQLRTNGFELLGTVVSGGLVYHEADLVRSVAVVMGNEAHGLDPRSAAQLDQLVSIPMAGSTESLNVAMAGTVLCFELLRQRQGL